MTSKEIIFTSTAINPVINEPFMVPVKAEISDFIEMFEQYCLFSKLESLDGSVYDELYFIDHEDIRTYLIHEINGVTISKMVKNDILDVIEQQLGVRVNIPSGKVHFV